jgi:hypothetical protein
MVYRQTTWEDFFLKPGIILPARFKKVMRLSYFIFMSISKLLSISNWLKLAAHDVFTSDRYRESGRARVVDVRRETNQLEP